MMNKQAQNVASVPFKTPGDLLELKEWFFPFSGVEKRSKTQKSDKRSRAVQKVRALMTRGATPHALEMTAVLTEIVLSDPLVCDLEMEEFEMAFPLTTSTKVNDLMLRSCYSSVIIRFVNGLLDPLQQGVYAISLHKLANNLNLPSHFVEMRHVCTHESLPSLEMLRLTCLRALRWLRDNYWMAMVDSYKEVDSSEYFSSQPYHDQSTVASPAPSFAPCVTRADLKQCEKILKAIKKKRKDALSKSSSVSQDISSEVDQLAKTDHELVCKVFINKNYLMPHGEKCQSLTEKQLLGLKLLWGPFIQSLPLEFLMEMWTQLLNLGCSTIIVNDMDDTFIDDQLLASHFTPYPQCELEISICSDWCVWILENTSLINDPRAFETVKRKGPCGLSLRCLQAFATNESSNQLDKILKLKATWTRFWIPGSIKVETKQTRDLMYSDEQQASKRLKKSPEIMLFRPIPNYKPTPFGCVP